MNRSRLLFPIGVILASAMFLFTTCPKDQAADEQPEPFFISNLGVTFAPWNPTDNTAGDFLFVPTMQKIFLEFGAVVGDGQGGTKALPTFEYYLKKDAEVFAIAAGEVARFVYQEDTEDWEIGVSFAPGSGWYIGYDHILSPTVGMGDRVQAGDILGNPGTWNAQVGRFEIMINNDATGYSYCPFHVFDPALAEEYRGKVLQLMQDWEAYKGNPNIYDEAAHSHAGCTVDSMETY